MDYRMLWVVEGQGINRWIPGRNLRRVSVSTVYIDWLTGPELHLGFSGISRNVVVAVVKIVGVSVGWEREVSIHENLTLN